MRNVILGVAVVAATLGAATLAQAQDCAVSAPNGEASLAAGAVDGGKGVGPRDAYQLDLSGAIGLGCRFGAQFDLNGSSIGGNRLTGVGGHLFARDPAKYLVGVTAAYLDADKAPGASYVAAEGEAYLGQWTLAGLAGSARTKGLGSDGIYAASVAYYPTVNLKLSLSGLNSFSTTQESLRAEWQPGLKPLSLFADVSAGDHDFVGARIGAKLAFGGASKSLIDRNRHDDPESLLYTFGLNYNLSLETYNALVANGGLTAPVGTHCSAGTYAIINGVPGCYL